MAKEEGIVIDGVVEEALPGTTFKVKLNNGSMVLCHLSGKMKMHFIRVLPGDSVTIEMSPYDLTKGRITRREIKKGFNHATEDKKSTKSKKPINNKKKAVKTKVLVKKPNKKLLIVQHEYCIPEKTHKQYRTLTAQILLTKNKSILSAKLLCVKTGVDTTVYPTPNEDGILINVTPTSLLHLKALYAFNLCMMTKVLQGFKELK